MFVEAVYRAVIALKGQAALEGETNIQYKYMSTIHMYIQYSTRVVQYI